MINKVEVRAAIETLGRQGPEVVIDGEPLPGVRSAIASMDVGYIPTVTVELHARAVHVDGEFRFELDEGTIEALRKLGWTPPTDGAPGVQS